MITSDLISRTWLSKTLEQKFSVSPEFLLRTEYPIPSQAIACGAYVGHSSTESGFLQLYKFTLVSNIPSMLLSHISFIYHRRQTLPAIGTSVKQKKLSVFKYITQQYPHFSKDIHVLSREALRIKLKLQYQFVRLNTTLSITCHFRFTKNIKT